MDLRQDFQKMRAHRDVISANCVVTSEVAEHGFKPDKQARLGGLISTLSFIEIRKTILNAVRPILGRFVLVSTLTG